MTAQHCRAAGVNQHRTGTPVNSALSD
jgi:hypothetical protein